MEQQGEFSKELKEFYNKAIKYDWKHFKPLNKRQFDQFAYLGVSALDDDDADQVIIV